MNKIKDALIFIIVWIFIFFSIHVFKSLWVAIFLFHGIILTTLLFNWRRINLRDIIKGWNLKYALICSSLGVISGVALFFLWDFFGINSSKIIELGFNKATIFLVIYFSTVNPILEELFWRKLYYSQNQKLSITDLGFVGYHLIVLSYFAPILFLIVAAIGLVIMAQIWNKIVFREKGILVPILSHAIIDFVLIFVAVIKM